LIALREKTSKSRTPSVSNSPTSMRSSEQRIIEEECDTDNDDDNENIHEDKSLNNRHSVERERLDSQVSSLHQDVATLSLEVRNAIQVLQEMTHCTMTQMDQHIPTRSIPNLQNDCGNDVHDFLIRSSSQPVDIWHRSNSHNKSATDLVFR
jgi:potassium voltage-gated channel Eag-related subfamily H member 8